MELKNKWIKCCDKLPPLWKWVAYYDQLNTNEVVVAKRTLMGYWKYKSGLDAGVVCGWEKWRPLKEDADESKSD